MENFEWIFDGIGTELIIMVIGLAIGALGGGVAGYKICSKNKIKQKQQAGEGSKQIQIGSVNYNGDEQAEPNGRR